ncbi:hypothetical protein K443DRAFT_673447 [Laccaria amethystina LaAM-08-1]|uniref:Uncharacterized protein n=1 Tax=Laccaria amethystina LaAM-08-1 TaxID=1095629 RepID=A0A0C9Y104_9AGAR|nr:hypothetical protein K443DRAFT_684003 [Laccaria amethystina LaAM-08-1]KIK07539.1 hypothetical protein K443DRAFT_673447 [Laccaria amethystina LaAM-08-1]
MPMPFDIALNPLTGTGKPICCTCPLPTGPYLCACRQRLLQPPTTAPTTARPLPNVASFNDLDAPSSDESFVVRPVHNHQNAASLFSDVNGEELIPQPCLKMALLKAMGFGRRLFAALFFTA